MEKIVLVGGGGHCKVIIDIIKGSSQYEIVGITDEKDIGEDILDIPVIGDDSILPELYNKGVKNAFVCIGALNNIKLRDVIFNRLKGIGFNIPKLIHKEATISHYAKIEDGTCVMAGTVINPGTMVEENCIVNTGAVIEHDCVIGRNTHVSPRSCILGGCKVGDNCHIGAGSTILQGVSIGDDVVIGAGAVVLKDIENSVTAVGIPAKIIKSR
jgi:UDP-perosamine 4-acetyltransferase